MTAPLCRPSLASLATGLYSHQNGIRSNYPEAAEKMFQALEKSSYKTVRVFLIGRSEVNRGIAGNYKDH